MNLLICFNVGGYRDALCKIGNEMHSDYRYSHSRLARTSAVRTAAKFPFYCRLLLANNKDTSPAVRGPAIRIRVFLRNKRTI